MRQKLVTLQARVIHFLDPHARARRAPSSGRRATMLVGLGASLAGSVLFAIRLTSRAYDMNGAGVRCFRTVMISPAY